MIYFFYSKFVKLQVEHLFKMNPVGFFTGVEANHPVGAGDAVLTGYVLLSVLCF